MRIAVLGAGAFGTALAIALAAEGAPVGLWCRSPEAARAIAAGRENRARLPGAILPESVSVSAEDDLFAEAGILLLAVPMQQLAGFLETRSGALGRRKLVACAKGIDLATGQGPTSLIAAACPDATAAVLTGPSFAQDIATGLPTALTLACRDDGDGARLQAALATAVLRLYRTDDVTGAELGGALKNVIAIAAGVVTGARLGDSARAALMTRGFAEMNRIALALGARAETLAGLSGLGDLVLTCTSPKSRNFAFGHALGSGTAFDPEITVEGVATARAAIALARHHGLDLPVATMVAALAERRIAVEEAMTTLLSRPLKKE
ncbi:MAG: NAD(P)-dependent glycerol-3-phosphate dehydrogenase [Defluviimonas sp.]|nr:NAD(P)-dependent glycerol-3-phosphate dehydrogenase [Defluviimonas sp.]